MRRHPIVTGVFGTLAGLMVFVLLVRFVLLDFTGRPFCHKQIYLEFVRTNERPHWQAVVAEHSRFLEGIAAASE